MTIKRKLLGNALFTSSLMLVILATLVWSLGDLQRGLESIVDNSKLGAEKSQDTETTLLKVSHDLSAASTEMATVVRDIGITTQAIKINERKISQVSETLNEFTETINDLLDGMPDGESRWGLEDLADELVDIEDSLRKEALVGLAESVKSMNEFTTRINHSAKVTDELVVELQTGTENSRQSSEAASEISNLSVSFGKSFAGKQNLLTALIILAVIFTIGTGILIIRALAAPLNKAVTIAEGIADGNLDQEVDLHGNDEIGQLGNAMRKMIQELVANRDLLESRARKQQYLIDQVTETSREIAGGSSLVATSSSALSQGTMDQSSSLEEINSSVNMLTDQIKSTAGNAQHANGLATDTQKAVENGISQTEELTQAMGDIHNSSEEISKIIKTIDDIAFQTNLLALNAAVEAARAGKHGKGFAVVAEEVRNLAGRSAKAARETANLIDESVARADRGLDSVENTSSALKNISTTVNQTAGLVAEISSTATEQSSGMDEIKTALGQVGLIVQQAADSSQETASASEKLSSQSERLRVLLETSSKDLEQKEDNSMEELESFQEESELTLV